MKPSTLNQLIDKSFENTISEQELALLKTELLENTESLNYYIDQVELHSMLSQPKESSLPRTNVIPMKDIIRRQKIKTFKKVVLSVAAVIILMVVSLQLYSTEPLSLTFKAAAGTQYSLYHPDKENSPEGMRLLKGSQLKISQGAIELTFSSGVKAIIQAPADLVLKKDDILVLNEGTGWFHVPKNAVGFQVNTPHCQVVDLGTEFGVHTHPSKLDQIHLFKGKIEVSSTGALKNTEILSGETARLVDPAGRLKTIPLNPELFEKELLSTHSQLIAWQAVGGSSSTDLSNVKAPVLHNNLEHQTSMGLNGHFAPVTLIAEGDQLILNGKVTFSGIDQKAKGASLNFGIFTNDGSTLSPKWIGYRTTCSGAQHHSHLRLKDTSTLSPCHGDGKLLWKSSIGTVNLKNKTDYHFRFCLTKKGQGILIDSSMTNGTDDLAKLSSFYHATESFTFNAAAFLATDELSANQVSFKETNVHYYPK